MLALWGATPYSTYEAVEMDNAVSFTQGIVIKQVRASVEPVVLFSIIDHYSRRDKGQDFVVGTLLGTEEDGVVTISSAFPVPHTEVEDQIALNTDFHTTMLGLHQRVNTKQTVVGWYSTGEAMPHVVRRTERWYDASYGCAQKRNLSR